MLEKLQISFFNSRKFLLVLTPVIVLISCTIGKDPLPEKLYGFKLVNKLTGEEAKKFVDHLHLNEVAPQENEIGFYKSPVGSLMIYVTYYDDNAKSKSEYKKMISKISPENLVFYDPSIVTIDQKDVYKCYGMAQVHYVFPSGKELYWVSVDPGLGDKFIAEYLNHIK